METLGEMKSRIDELAGLMDEYRLNQAELSGEGWRVAFKRKPTPSAVVVSEATVESESHTHEPEPAAVGSVAPLGTPVTSPMMGIFYLSASPAAAPFVKEGEPVTAGQVVALIEAMKVFNEIVAPLSGTVLRIIATNGSVVNPGEPLLYIG